MLKKQPWRQSSIHRLYRCRKQIFYRGKNSKGSNNQCRGASERPCYNAMSMVKLVHIAGRIQATQGMWAN